MAVCLYLQVILMICFLFQPSGQLLLVCCTVFHIKNSYAKFWLSPRMHKHRANTQSQINNTPRVSVRSTQYTTVKGDSELEHDHQVQPCLLQKTPVTELITILLPLSQSQIVNSLKLLNGCPIRFSEVTFNMICNKGVQHNILLFFFNRNALFRAQCLLQKRAKTLLYNSVRSAGLKEFSAYLCPVPQHFLCQQFAITAYSSINTCDSPILECHGI